MIHFSLFGRRQMRKRADELLSQLWEFPFWDSKSKWKLLIVQSNFCELFECKLYAKAQHDRSFVFQVRMENKLRNVSRSLVVINWPTLSLFDKIFLCASCWHCQVIKTDNKSLLLWQESCLMISIVSFS